MEIKIFQTAAETGKAAGIEAISIIEKTIETNGIANIILATGVSQFDVLQQLTMTDLIDWTKVVMFHLDEYIALPETHPASFRKYLRDRFLVHLPQLKAAHLIQADLDPANECARLSELIRKHPIDIALVGIGENGHLAFNDPPADFDTDLPYITVSLDEACRKQQLGEGWFGSMDEVPRQAISMSIKQIMKSKRIICTVPDSRKANAVKNCLTQPINPLFPASILQAHDQCTVYLDSFSSSLLPDEWPQ